MKNKIEPSDAQVIWNFLYLANYMCGSLGPFNDLSSGIFILALRRFIAWHGKPREIHSDNDTDFIGTDRELCKSPRDLNQYSNCGIVCKFNPPG